jgi:hypothetical protein
VAEGGGGTAPLRGLLPHGNVGVIERSLFGGGGRTFLLLEAKGAGLGLLASQLGEFRLGEAVVNGWL